MAICCGRADRSGGPVGSRLSPRKRRLRDRHRRPVPSLAWRPGGVDAPRRPARAQARLRPCDARGVRRGDRGFRASHPTRQSEPLTLHDCSRRPATPLASTRPVAPDPQVDRECSRARCEPAPTDGAPAAHPRFGTPGWSSARQSSSNGRGGLAGARGWPRHAVWRVSPLPPRGGGHNRRLGCV